MASEAVKEGGAANQENRDDGVSIDLPAPEGWKKTFTPRRGGTPRRNDIVFISPTGEEIRSRKQLEQYLKSHPGDLSASDFDWGTGDTPRRSARIGQKSKATETPESAPSQKRQNKSSSKKGAEEKKDDVDGEGETVKEKVAPAALEETKAGEEVEMKDAEDVGDKSQEEIADKEALAAEDTGKDSEQKVEEKIDELNIEKLENQGADNNLTSNTQEEQGVIKSLPTPVLEENKEEAEKQSAKLEAPPKLENQDADDKTTSDTKEDQAGKSSLPAPGMEESKKEAEKQPVETEAPASVAVPNENASSDKEATTEKVSTVGEVKPDNGSSEEGHDVAKPVENHSARCEEAPHEPKASEVSC